MPSIADIIFILLLFAMTCGALAPRLLGDADVGWHIRNGELILRTHTITHVDPFSSTMQGKPWYSWEWMYDAGVGALNQWAGLNAVVLISAILIAFTFALLFRLTLARGGNVVVTFSLLVLTLGAAAIHLFARPHIISWLFVVVWFHLLDSAETTDSARSRGRIFWLPLIMLIWVNVHGEFLFGFVLLGIYFASGVLRFFFMKNDVDRRPMRAWLQRLAIVSAISAAVTFINPNGYKLHLHIYSYLNDRWLMDHIEEFQSPNFHGWAQQCFVLLLLITFASLAFTRKRLRLSQLLVVLFAVHGGFYASRNLPTSCMLLTLIVAPLLSGMMLGDSHRSSWVGRLFARSGTFVQRMGFLESRLRWHMWPVLATLGALIVCAHGGRLARAQIMDAHFDPAHFPVESAEFLAHEHSAGPVFAPDAWGGYLIYRLAPATKVFVDDRHDLYGDTFMKNYLTIVSVSPEWKNMLDQTKVPWVLAKRGSSLANILEQTSEWKSIHKDDTAELFQRD